MYNGKKVSVAMATYQGEKFIEEQLRSICTQTVRPDEIVISDDGSKDRTAELVRRFMAGGLCDGISVSLLTDNPHHGYCGNFEWALQHTTGDYVFFSDQDDVWMPEKVRSVIDFFCEHPEAGLVCHNAVLIDAAGKALDGVFDLFLAQELFVPEGAYLHIAREQYLERAVSGGGLHGMSLCLSRSLIRSSLPFPRNFGSHDKWVTFCAVLEDSLYYLNLPLAKYRLHGNNVCGNLSYRGTFLQKLRRHLNRLQIKSGRASSYYFQGMALHRRLLAAGYGDHPACGTARRIWEIGSKLRSAEESRSFAGACKLCRLFRTDMRYRRSGTGDFLQELAYIAFHTRKYRRAGIGAEP